MDNNNDIEKKEEISLEDKVKDLEGKLKESEEKYLRSLADFENSRRRFEKMQADLSKYAIAEFAREMLGTLDIFNKAFIGVKEDEIADKDFKNFAFGIRLTQKEMEKSLQKFGVTKIDCFGKKFDANLHESLFAKPDTTKENGTIIEVVEDGFVIGERLLRPAKVGIVQN